jgi:hypothetical protein
MKTNPGTPIRQWLDWQPKDAITADSPQSEPTKPSKPGFVGFVGSFPDDPPKIVAPEEAPAEGQGPYRFEAAVDSPTAPERVMSWAEWKAAALNRLFLEQGTLGQPGRITAETVLHGERMNRVLQQRRARRAGA